MRSDRVRERTTSLPAEACTRLAELLPGVVDGTAILAPNERRHVDGCLRCQAELAQYRRLLRAMRSLHGATAAAPADLVADVLAHLEEAGDRSAIRAALAGRKGAYLGGIAAATAAGAGAAIVLVSRGRKARFPLAG